MIGGSLRKSIEGFNLYNRGSPTNKSHPRTCVVSESHISSSVGTAGHEVFSGFKYMSTAAVILTCLWSAVCTVTLTGLLACFNNESILPFAGMNDEVAPLYYSGEYDVLSYEVSLYQLSCCLLVAGTR